MSDTLQALYAVIQDRQLHPQEGSYTCYLFEKGVDKILKKVGEECAETIIAAKNDVPSDTVGEISDLIYHLMVMMVERNIPLEDVLDELDCDTAWALYGLEEAGLSREDLTDGVIYRSAGATCEELSLLIFSDSGAAQTAQGALEAYLQSQIENNRDYRPGEIPKLEDAVLRQEGSTVLLAVSADTPAVEALLG